MILQPINLFLSSIALCGTMLAALQVSVFSATPPVSAMTASLEINAPQITGSPVIGKHLVTRSSDGLFYVDGSIKGVPVKFAIDTGASVVVLNATDAERVGLKTERTPTHHIRTASGYSEMSWSEANDFVIAGKNIGKIDIAVMNNGPSVSLLGLNALSRLETVTIRKDQLIIE